MHYAMKDLDSFDGGSDSGHHPRKYIDRFIPNWSYKGPQRSQPSLLGHQHQQHVHQVTQSQRLLTRPMAKVVWRALCLDKEVAIASKEPV